MNQPSNKHQRLKRQGLLAILEDFNISYQDSGSGWINIERCPFCSDQKYHLGYNRSGDYCNCWKCGGHSVIDVLMVLLGLTFFETKRLLSDYSHTVSREPKVKSTNSALAKETKIPGGCTALKEQHRRYLIGRGFDPDELVRVWHLLAAPHYGIYKHRIIAPIYHDGKLVSFQSRDITSKAKLRYISAAKEQEVREHKHCLYGLDLVKGDRVIVVEGIADAWKLGAGAVATFGIEWTQQQLALLKRFKEVFIIYDTQSSAQAQALKLASAISAFGTECSMVTLDERYKDPAELPEREAIYLKKQLSI